MSNFKLPYRDKEPVGDDDRMDYEQGYRDAVRYLREKINQMLAVMGTLPLREEELDDAMLISLDPLGIIAASFQQVLDHLHSINQDLALANEEIQAIMDAAGAAIVVTNRELVVEMANTLSETILLGGDSKDSIVGKQCSELLAQLNHGMWGLLSRVIKGQEPSGYVEVQIQERYYNLVITSLRDERGEADKIIFLLADITYQKEADEKLRMMAAVFENTSEGIMITDAGNRMVMVNRALCDITGYESSEMLGRDPKILNSGHHNPEFFLRIWTDLETKGSWRGEIWDRKKNGEIFAALQSISVIRRMDGTVSNHIAVLTDISSLKESQAQLDYLAYHDTLTGLGNRLFLNERLQNSIQRARRRSSLVAILFLDLDRFKTINDSLGHPVGDEVLVHVADRLQEVVRREDAVARLSGDEFVIVMEDIQSDTVVTQVAEKIIETVSQPIQLDRHELTVTVSIGICLYPEDGDDAIALVKNADAAMYLAKRAGKNNYKFYTHQLSAESTERLQLENALRVAVDRNDFELHYQPVFSLRSKEIIGAEALLRWRHEDLGWISPEKFIPIAEDTDLIIPLGEWVLRSACARMQRWLDAGAEFSFISVNFSGVQLKDAGIADRVLEILAETGLPASMLELGITENAIMQQTQAASEFLARLRQSGVHFAIDDFGTGYSSLSYLKRLPVDKLKIDRSFVIDMPDNRNDTAIAEAVIALGHTLGMAVVAEGIENEEQLMALRYLRCNEGQGSLVSEPLSADEFEQKYLPGAFA